MKFTTVDHKTVVWNAGEISGDADLVSAVRTAVEQQTAVEFNFWGDRVASISTPFDAYVTIGSVLGEIYGEVDPTVDEVPDNPDGYEPEGPRFETPIVAAAHRYLER